MERSDAFTVQIDTKSGLISYDDKKEDKVMVNIPYAMKLMIQELQTMCIAPRIVTETNITNIPVFNFLYENVSKYSINNNFIDEEVLEEQE